MTGELIIQGMASLHLKKHLDEDDRSERYGDIYFGADSQVSGHIAATADFILGYAARWNCKS